MEKACKTDVSLKTASSAFLLTRGLCLMQHVYLKHMSLECSQPNRASYNALVKAHHLVAITQHIFMVVMLWIMAMLASRFWWKRCDACINNTKSLCLVATQDAIDVDIDMHASVERMLEVGVKLAKHVNYDGYSAVEWSLHCLRRIQARAVFLCICVLLFLSVIPHVPWAASCLQWIEKNLKTTTAHFSDKKWFVWKSCVHKRIVSWIA